MNCIHEIWSWAPLSLESVFPGQWNPLNSSSYSFTLILRNSDFWSTFFLYVWTILKMNVLPSEQLAFAPRSKSICCDISFCLLISVFRSLQMGQLGEVGKAPQTSSSKKEGKNKRHKIPLKIRTAILSRFDFSLNSIWSGLYLTFMQLTLCSLVLKLILCFQMHLREIDWLSLPSDTSKACWQ